ncbi:8238_t:CDS:2, partial [Scutellospora calospora]
MHRGRILRQNEEPEHDTNLWNTSVIKIQRLSILTEIHIYNTGKIDDTNEQDRYDNKNLSNMSVEESLKDTSSSSMLKEFTIQLAVS